MTRYPPHSRVGTPNGQTPQAVVPSIRPSTSGAPVLPPGAKLKGISAADALKTRAAMNPGPSVMQPQRPEDKPDSPEYKKKRAMITGPILELTSENASTYGLQESPFTALKDIFTALVSSPSRTGVLSPQHFLDIFKQGNEMFRTAMHQDAHEFYGLVLNHVITALEDHTKRIRELEDPLDDASLARSMQMAAEAGPGTPGTGWVHEIFEGVLTSETRCLTCETPSQRDETFLDLSIDLEDNSSVTSCLRKFSAEEMLCERNKFHCDHCGGLQEAEKRMKIRKLPKILTLHLKRFKYTEDMMRLQKLLHRVVYPYYLRMFITTDDAEDPDRLYELYAVVVHIGANAYHGHYVSVIKTKDRGWLLFDDEMVEPVDKHYVRNFFGDKPGQACAYLLFYQETTVEAMRQEQEAEGLAEVNLASKEADVAAGQIITNGTHPSSTSKSVAPTTPLEERNEFIPLPHAATTPISPHPSASPKPAHAPTTPIMIPTSTPVTLSTPRQQTKEEKERDKKEAKEAEKARKALEKERAKEIERRRKDIVESKRKEIESQGASGTENALPAYDAMGNQSPAPKEKEKENKPFGLGSLSRHGKGSKSMSRKSLNWLTREGRNSSSAPANNPNNSVANGHANGNGHGHSNSKNSSSGSGEYTSTSATTRSTLGEDNRDNGRGDVSTPLVHSFGSDKWGVNGKEKEKEKKFSFGALGRKKSSMMRGES